MPTMRRLPLGIVLFIPLMLGLLSPAGAAPPQAQYKATLLRDAYGVPHLFGKTPADVAYALGQVQCEDRLDALLYNLHAGSGRLAELLGERLLQADKEQRLLRHRAMAKRDWRKLSPELRQVIEAFTQGVNDWIAAHPRDLPAPVQPFSPLDVVAWHRHLMMLSAVKIARIDGETRLADKHPGPPPGKSNSWAVAGAKSSTGKPILLIDPHWPIQGHLQLYEAHVHAGDWQAWGFLLVGTPLIGLGATPGVAWTFTAGGADSSDAFALKINPKDPNQYEFDGKSVPMEVWTETLRIKHEEGFREEQATFRATRHGPVFTNSRGEPFAAGLAGWDNAQALEQFWRMNLARSARQFKAALALDRLSYFNLMWASAGGHIGYVQLGDVPLRPAGLDWTRQIPGWTSATLYRGQVPFTQLPQVEDPPTHFLQNCNTAANVVTPGLTFTPGDFPPGVLYGHYGAYRARGQRATQLLSAAKKLDVEAARRLVFDTYSPPADLWIPILLAAVEEAHNPLPLREAAKLLKTWDRHVDRDSPGATLFRFWRLHCAALPRSQAGRDAFTIKDTPELRKDALQALEAAVGDLKKRYGRLAIPWGEIKRLKRGDQEWPLSGDGLGELGLDTLRATAGAQLNPANKMIIGGGQSTIGLVFLGEEPEIHAVVAFGQSNRPDSRHFADQAPLYANHQLRRVPWNEKAIRAQVTEQRTISSVP